MAPGRADVNQAGRRAFQPARASVASGAQTFSSVPDEPRQGRMITHTHAPGASVLGSEESCGSHRCRARNRRHSAHGVAWTCGAAARRIIALATCGSSRSDAPALMGDRVGGEDGDGQQLAVPPSSPRSRTAIDRGTATSGNERQRARFASMKTMSPKELVERWVELFNAGDADARACRALSRGWREPSSSGETGGGTRGHPRDVFAGVRRRGYDMQPVGHP
jgi:hypothetical protein